MMPMDGWMWDVEEMRAGFFLSFFSIIFVSQKANCVVGSELMWSVTQFMYYYGRRVPGWPVQARHIKKEERKKKESEPSELGSVIERKKTSFPDEIDGELSDSC